MKKLIIGIAITIIIIIGVLILLTSKTIGRNDILESSFVLIIVVGIGVLILFRKFISVKKGEVTDDELSKLILQKSSSLSFYISLYLWLIISYLGDRINFETEQIIGYGIIGMAVIFAGIWSFLKIKCLKK